jgi:cytochrome c-type biogenesis protein CcmH/NrfG
MNKESKETKNPAGTWRAWEVYIMAAVCLVLGVSVGYLVRGSTPASPSTNASQQNAAAGSAPQQMPSLEDMKHMADKQAAPLLAKLQSDPNNADLLNQIGTVYRMTHQFDTAASYYQRSLQANPRNVGARTDLASCMYYEGDVDGAIAQLEKSLTYDPKHAGTLLNLGIVRWKGKSDTAGAIAAWNKLLKYHPDYDNKEMVQKLIADARAHPGKRLLQSE